MVKKPIIGYTGKHYQAYWKYPKAINIMSNKKKAEDFWGKGNVEMVNIVPREIEIYNIWDHIDSHSRKSERSGMKARKITFVLVTDRKKKNQNSWWRAVADNGEVYAHSEMMYKRNAKRSLNRFIEKVMYGNFKIEETEEC